MRFAGSLVLLGACGRLGFEDVATNSRVPDAGFHEPEDAPVQRPCGAKDTAPDPLTIAGDVFLYTDFTNDRMYLTGTTVKVSDGPSALATATSGANGLYTATIGTDGLARTLLIHGDDGGTSWDTETFSDTGLDHSLSVAGGPIWRFGEITLWGDAAMTAIYNVLGPTIDPARGTLNVTVAACDNSPLDGVSIRIDPTPEGGMYYLDASGTPHQGATATIGPYADVIAANVIPGPVTITATAPGMTFAPLTIDVLGGRHNTIVMLQPN